MLADVYGTSSNSRKIDESDPQGNVGHYRLTQGIATTLLMASVGAKQNKGLDIKQIKLCVIRPKSFNHNDVDGALNKLEQIAHYLYSSKIGIATYWFESKPNINILLSQAKSEIKQEEAFSEILNRLKDQISSTNKLKILINPTGDVPELKSLTLIIMHPEHTVAIGGKASHKLETKVKEIALKRGNSDRTIRNTIIFLACSEAGCSALISKLTDYLACNKIITEYKGRLEKDQNDDIVNRKKEFDKKVNEALIRAFNEVIKYSAKEGLKTYELKDYSNDFSTQINTNLLNEIIEEEWIIKSVGRKLLENINMLPTTGYNVRIKDLYEAFLRYDDKPMITGPEAIKDTINRFCSNRTFNVGFGTATKFTNIYSGQTVPFLEVDSDEYWLLDPSVVMELPPVEKKTEPGTEPKLNPPSPPTQEPKQEPEPVAKTYKKIIISGNVPIENYSQLFSSFINTLKNNRLKIEVKFTASSTDSNPLTENSQLIKSVKESASQLGLKFEEN